mmetsp:Transcript_2436/g.5821  ORF Transcript_2436/g.5821 Transcript_2436/m.5821 type:complete len:201 (-) Transcript_2436:719-1321(-)
MVLRIKLPLMLHLQLLRIFALGQEFVRDSRLLVIFAQPPLDKVKVSLSLRGVTLTLHRPVFIRPLWVLQTLGLELGGGGGGLVLSLVRPAVTRGVGYGPRVDIHSQFVKLFVTVTSTVALAEIGGFSDTIHTIAAHHAPVTRRFIQRAYHVVFRLLVDGQAVLPCFLPCFCLGNLYLLLPWRNVRCGSDRRKVIGNKPVG